MQPEPHIVEVCSECGEPWGHHTARSRARVIAQYYRDLEDYANDLSLPSPGEHPPDGQGLVILEDCIALLKLRGVGPMGPQGVIGLQGERGERGIQGEQGRHR